MLLSVAEYVVYRRWFSVPGNRYWRACDGSHGNVQCTSSWLHRHRRHHSLCSDVVYVKSLLMSVRCVVAVCALRCAKVHCSSLGVQLLFVVASSFQYAASELW